MFHCPKRKPYNHKTVVTVKHKNHRQFTLTFSNKKTVTGREIKNRISSKKGICKSNMTLLFNNKVLNDYESLPSLSYQPMYRTGCKCRRRTRGGVNLSYGCIQPPIHNCCSHISHPRVNRKTITLITSGGCGIFNPPHQKKITIIIITNNGVVNIKISPNATIKQLRNKINRKLNLHLNGVDFSHSCYHHQTLASLGICNNTTFNAIGNQGIFPNSYVQPTPVVFPGNFANPNGGIDIYGSNNQFVQAPQFPPNPTIPQDATTNTVVINSGQGPVIEAQTDDGDETN